MDELRAERTGIPLTILGIGIKTGLIGGIVAVLIALQGMIQTFSIRDVISGILSMSQTLLLITFFGTAYVAVGRSRSTNRLLMLVVGALSGFISSLLLVILIWLGSVVNLGGMFINATPQLYELLTFKRGVTTGSVIQLIFGIGAGIASALIYLLPSRARRPIMAGLVTILAFGFFQDWVIRTISNTPPLFRFVLEGASRFVYAGNGVATIGTIVLFVLTAALYFLWAEKGSAFRGAVNKLSPAGRRAYRVTIGAVLILILLSPPVFLGIQNCEILDTVGLFVLMGLGLNIVVGFAGLLDLGYVAFFAIGAYAVGFLTSTELAHPQIMGNWWAALPFGLVVAVLAGIVLGVPVLKMRGDYLAIVTLGFGEIIRLLAGSDLLLPLLGGAQGTRSIARPDIGPIQFGFQRFTLPLLGQIEFQVQQEFYYLIIAGCLLAVFVAVRVKNSRLGRAWMAVREDEDVAQAMGINLVATKLAAFAMGAFFGGLSGALQASKLGSIFPFSFNFIVSVNVLALIIIGGMGSIPGVAAGSFLLIGLPELLREFAEYRLLFYGAALVLMMLLRPEGFWPEAARKRELHEAGPGEAEPEPDLASSAGA